MSMTGPAEFWRRLKALFRKRELDREFDDELSGHIEMATADYVRQGMEPIEARRRARIKLGGVDAAKELHRESRGLAWIEGLGYDLRHALRGLKRDRFFALTAISMLTLAITLNVAVFVIMNTMLFRGFPLVERSDQVVYLYESNFATGHGRISYSDFEDWRKQVNTFGGLAFVNGLDDSISFRGGEHGSNIWTFQVSANAFGLLGVSPMLGRDFLPADEKPGAAPVVLLSYRFWETRMGKRGNVIGSAIWLNKVPTTVVGVMPKASGFPRKILTCGCPLFPR